MTDLQDAFWGTGEKLLLHHTNPWELDEALCRWGYGLGPCEAQDLLGLDKVLARYPCPVSPVLPRMVAEGRMGKSGGVGYYRYPGGGGAVVDPLIEDLILEEAWFAGIRRVELIDTALVAQMNAAVMPVVRRLTLRGTRQEDIGRLLQDALHFPADRPLVDE
ncbi:hypothetical protein OS190_03395 [Sulfitobacter sp. F26204]|uniref:hypothetical protein n=1 Tax=Sulfitobacter sp. F26204 TaxID=2996014 RepID=UPI00225DF800|nr:hypothetical protein [Sulfitobacter sp. F26204]MCX7558596.1 hypothetical protein [Sulfitobacter sp. F26204]